MNREIYYFTGTGNSLTVAKEISNKTNAKLIPIASQMERESVAVQADNIGIVFPVYYADIPTIIKRFVEKLQNIQNKYIFALCTYGGGIGDSIKTMSQLLHAHSAQLSAAFGVHMPQNAFHKPWENRETIYRKNTRRLEIICKAIQQQKRGMPFSDRLSYWALVPLHGLIKSMYKKSFVKLSDSPSNLTIEELINLADKSFNADENCDGCGICSLVCPVNNIQITNGKPVWRHHCENCLACYNWCPSKAIQCGIVQTGYYYKNPHVTIAEIIKQKEGAN